jgi:meiotic recombination protein SPO11
MATRIFLRKISFYLNLPVLALMDGDISRFNILVCYKNGSAKMSYDSENLTTPDIYWLGVRPSDIFKYNIPQKYTKFLSERELIDVQNVLNKPYVKRHSS